MINSFSDIIKVAGTQVQLIPYIENDTNFWMIRCKQGMFYKEFINEEFVAIGWNVLTKNALHNDNDDNLKKHVTSNGYKDKMPGMAINKCHRFVDEIKENDIAVIVGRTEITFAYIGSFYEFTDASTTIEKELDIIAKIERGGNHLTEKCPYQKRRHIRIISKVNIELVSPAIYRCLVANRHSLSNLNEYADAIISSSYDVAYYNNRLIVKYHIGQPRDINPFDFSIFTYNIVNVLAINEREIIGKYNINSEGDVVLFLVNSGKDIYEFIRENIASLWVIYLMIFGGKGLGFEIPSAVDKIKEWVTEILLRKETLRIKKAEADKAEAEVDKVKAEVAHINASTERINVETEIKKEELDAIRKKKEDEAIHTMQQLQQVSEPLQINTPSKEIVDLLIATFEVVEK